VFTNLWDEKMTINTNLKVYSSGKLNMKIDCEKDEIEPGEAVKCSGLGLIQYFDERLITVNHLYGKDSFTVDCSNS
jgi:hypothetical protein